MSCPKHPTYKAVRRPTADCASCRQMWEAKQYMGSPQHLADHVKGLENQLKAARAQLAATRQPMPRSMPGVAIQDLVIADIEARKKVGLERYGTLLRAHNGRDALMDLYQEILDAAQYCRQMIEERS